MPFIIKRISDGKYYRNPSYSQRNVWRYPGDKQEVLWTTNINECKPFASITACKLSHAANLRECVPYTQDIELAKAGRWSNERRLNGEIYHINRLPNEVYCTRRIKFEERFIAVEINYEKA